MAAWRLYARDITNRRQAEIKVYRRFECRSVYNDVGTWALDMPTDLDLFGVLPFRSGIVLTRDGVTVFSGPIRHIERRVVGGRTDDTLYGGTDDTGSLERVRILPVFNGPPYTAAAYDERTAPAETLMRDYVRDNCSTSAHIARRITGLVSGTSGALGLTIGVRARFDVLLGFLQNIALRAVNPPDDPLWFRVLQNSADPTILDFLVSLPVDRSRDVVFGFERRNLESYIEREEAPPARGGNYGIAGGKGELEQQTITEVGEGFSINRYGRHEFWLNDTQADDTSDLVAKILPTLIDAFPRSAVQATVRETEAAQAFVHYGIADRVTVVRDGVADVGLVREMSVKITPEDGVVVTPFIALDRALWSVGVIP